MERPYAQVAEQNEPPRLVHLVLLALTVATTALAGTLLAPRFYDLGVLEQFAYLVRNPSALLLGVPFMLPLLVILGIHEMGHFLTARRYGVRVTWPYFLPGPPFVSLGTFGAFIRLKGAIPDRGALMEIGANGPVWGFVASLGAGTAGYLLRSAGYLSPVDLGVNVRLPLAMWALRGSFTGRWDHTLTLFDNPVILAAWIGFFVQGLNLLPVGQLDGGHVLYAFARGGHRLWSVLIAVVFLGFALFHPEWLLWVLLIFFVLGLRHPPCLDDGVPLRPGQTLLGIAAAAIFVLTFVPLPFVWTD